MYIDDQKERGTRTEFTRDSESQPVSSVAVMQGFSGPVLEITLRHSSLDNAEHQAEVLSAAISECDHVNLSVVSLEGDDPVVSVYAKEKEGLTNAVAELNMKGMLDESFAEQLAEHLDTAIDRATPKTENRGFSPSL